MENDNPLQVAGVGTGAQTSSSASAYFQPLNTPRHFWLCLLIISMNY